MTMILQLLVAAVAVGLGVDVYGIPQYKEIQQAIEEATETLEKNVLSLEGNSPLLNDSRRHYAEIVHVVYYHGELRSGCLNGDYYDEYYPRLNISAPEAISKPELVVTKINDLRNDVLNIITELKDFINACVLESEVCNKLIHDTVIMNPEDFQHPANVLLAAGDVATDLNKLNEKFEEVSKNMNAHQYVCTTPKDLEHIVNSIAQLYRSLNPNTSGC